MYTIYIYLNLKKIVPMNVFFYLLNLYFSSQKQRQKSSIPVPSQSGPVQRMNGHLFMDKMSSMIRPCLCHCDI